MAFLKAPNPDFTPGNKPPTTSFKDSFIILSALTVFSVSTTPVANLPTLSVNCAKSAGSLFLKAA